MVFQKPQLEQGEALRVAEVSGGVLELVAHKPKGRMGEVYDRALEDVASF